MLGNLARQIDEAIAPAHTSELPDWLCAAAASQTVWARVCALAPTVRRAVVVGEAGSGKSLLVRHLHARSPFAAAPLVHCELARVADPLVVLGCATDTPRMVIVSGVQHLATPEQQRIAAWLERVPDSLAVVFEVPVRDASWLQSPRWAPALIAASAGDDGAYCLEVPAFEARTDDLIPLAHQMLEHYAQLWGRRPPRLLDDAAAAVARMTYRDNGHTLQQAMAHALLHHTTHAVALQHLPPQFAGRADRAGAMGVDAVALEEVVDSKLTQFFERLGDYDVRDLYDTVLAKMERPLFRLALQHADGNQVRAARLLGINRNTLRTRMRALGVHPGDPA